MWLGTAGSRRLAKAADLHHVSWLSQPGSVILFSPLPKCGDVLGPCLPLCPRQRLPLLCQMVLIVPLSFLPDPGLHLLFPQPWAHSSTKTEACFPSLRLKGSSGVFASHFLCRQHLTSCTPSPEGCEHSWLCRPFLSSPIAFLESLQSSC